MSIDEQTFHAVLNNVVDLVLEQVAVYSGTDKQVLATKFLEELKLPDDRYPHRREYIPCLITKYADVQKPVKKDYFSREVSRELFQKITVTHQTLIKPVEAKAKVKETLQQERKADVILKR